MSQRVGFYTGEQPGGGEHGQVVTTPSLPLSLCVHTHASEHKHVTKITYT